MASNADLIKVIVAAAEQLKIEAPKTDGLSNEQLAALASEMRERVKASEDAEGDKNKAAQDEDQAAREAAAAKRKKKAPKPKPPYYVAPGKAITCKRGILSGDTEDEVKPSHLSGGEKSLREMIERGLVLKG